jgi:superfamily II DNA/RNA helicase
MFLDTQCARLFLLALFLPFVKEISVSFENLNLNPLILKAILDAGYTAPTPVQAQAIPEALAGHDLMASAQTGTGKTAAFILPALQRLTTPATVNSRGPRVLVLTPTRELALQVTEAAAKYGKQLRQIKVVSILGGMPYPLQNKLLSQSVDILVATPGRLIDHLQRGRIDFSRLEMLILDEADRMLDMGFSEDVDTICNATPATRQTLMFSATFDGPMARLAQRLLKTPKRIEVAQQQAKHDNIEQRLHYVDDMAHKNRLLAHLLSDADLKQAIVFTATKRDADLLADGLYAQGHQAAALHGDMNQGARTRTLTQLRRGQIRVLVATDVAARGIDVPGISHVINYDLPKAAEDYVHRIGRTGRAGASGIAVSFASPRDGMNLSKIERFTGQAIAPHVIAGMEPKRSMRSGAPNVTHKRGRSFGNDSGAPRHNTGAPRHNSSGPGRNASPSGDRFGSSGPGYGSGKPADGNRSERSGGFSRGNDNRGNDNRGNTTRDSGSRGTGAPGVGAARRNTRSFLG